MTASDISEIKELLNSRKKIVIVPHKNPDGDAIGSSLGLWHYLRSLDHEAYVIAPNDYPEFLRWMPGNDEVIIYEQNRERSDALISTAEIIFTLDFNALNRTGEMEEPLEHSNAIKILIDHHQQPHDYAKYIYSDVSMCSTCQMIYHFMEMLDAANEISKDTANCLYAGIMTDTGSFRFPSTTSKTHRVVAALIDKGAENAEIHKAIFDNNTQDRLHLLGRALNNLHVIEEFKTAYITLSQEDLNEFNFKKGDTEGVVNYALSVKGVKFACIFIEQKHEGIIKISLRSSGDFDVNKFARAHFNGGGHINAAGGRCDLPLSETVEYFITILPQYSENLKS